jgi:hypothetical protein
MEIIVIKIAPRMGVIKERERKLPISNIIIFSFKHDFEVQFVEFVGSIIAN